HVISRSLLPTGRNCARGLPHATNGDRWAPVRIPHCAEMIRNAHRSVTVQRRGGAATPVPPLVVHHFDRLARTPGESILSFCIAGRWQQGGRACPRPLGRPVGGRRSSFLTPGTNLILQTSLKRLSSMVAFP